MLNLSVPISARWILAITVSSLGFTGCEPGSGSEKSEARQPPRPIWMDENAALCLELPQNFSEQPGSSGSLQLQSNRLPGHILGVQRLSENVGAKPLQILRESIQGHSHFTNFGYVSKWSRRLDSVWASAYHARYLHLDEPAARFGALVPTQNGYYEISYHAPNGPAPLGIAAFEQLLESVSLFNQDERSGSANNDRSSPSSVIRRTP